MIEVMGKHVVYTLLASCALSLVLPPGWCCVVGVGSCCGSQCRPVAEAPTGCDGCCCHDEPASPGPVPCCPAGPAEVPSCCSEREPAAAERSLSPQVDLPLTATLLPAEPSPLAGATGELHGSVPLHPPRPLHVLQCVWLC
jgi:hypothetical protein